MRTLRASIGQLKEDAVLVHRLVSVFAQAHNIDLVRLPACLPARLPALSIALLSRLSRG